MKLSEADKRMLRVVYLRSKRRVRENARKLLESMKRR